MQQVREAFPWGHGCRYLLRDRDAIYGRDLVAMKKALGMEEVITAPLSPNPFGVGQRRSGVENLGEARMRAHRRDSLTWRTPSPIPTPRRFGIVRRCPRLWFPISSVDLRTNAECSPAETLSPTSKSRSLSLKAEVSSPEFRPEMMPT
jgi:hypothetical protein